jgi:hypothetical protein
VESDSRDWLGWAARIITGMAVASSIIVVVFGAIYALLENAYTVTDYLEDLRTLVFGLAAVLIALELPASIHRRLNRKSSRKGVKNGQSRK